MNNIVNSDLPVLKVRLWSYNKKSLYEAEKIIINAHVLANNAKIKGPIPLPRKSRFWCLLKSPHVNKKAREHITATRYKRLIEIQTNLNIKSLFVPLSLPAGVNMKIM